LGGPTSKEREREGRRGERKGREEREGKERRGRGRGGDAIQCLASGRQT